MGKKLPATAVQVVNKGDVKDEIIPWMLTARFPAAGRYTVILFTSVLPC
jgi:hypothetical protein